MVRPSPRPCRAVTLALVFLLAAGDAAILLAEANPVGERIDTASQSGAPVHTIDVPASDLCDYLTEHGAWHAASRLALTAGSRFTGTLAGPTDDLTGVVLDTAGDSMRARLFRLGELQSLEYVQAAPGRKEDIVPAFLAIGNWLWLLSTELLHVRAGSNRSQLIGLALLTGAGLGGRQLEKARERSWVITRISLR